MSKIKKIEDNEDVDENVNGSLRCKNCENFYEEDESSADQPKKYCSQACEYKGRIEKTKQAVKEGRQKTL